MDPEARSTTPGGRDRDHACSPGADPELLDALQAARRNALSDVPPGIAGRPLLHWMLGRTSSRVACLIQNVDGEPGAQSAVAFAEAAPTAPLRRALEAIVSGMEDGIDAAREPWVLTTVPGEADREVFAALHPVRYRRRLLGAIGLAGSWRPYDPSVLRSLEPAVQEYALLLRLAAAEASRAAAEGHEPALGSDGLVSQALLQQIVDSLPQRIFWKDRAGFYLGANSAFRTDSGRDPVGLTDHDMPWAGEQADFFRECDRRVIESEQPEMNIVEPIRTEDGQQRWLSTCKMPLRDVGEHVFAVLGTYLDITSIKQNEIDLGCARDAAEEANRAKSEFLATMSHEIRTPLNGVLGYLELALEGGLDHEQQELVGTARNSGLTLLHIINDILDYSKLEAGKFTLEQRTYDLRSVVAGSVELLAPQAAEQGVDLTLVWENGVPAEIEGDAHRLRQVLVNLIGNAVKFSDGKPVTVVVSPSGPGSVRFEIIDRGIGIPLDKRDRIFEHFSQADSSTTRRFGGTGLGLAISRRITEAMGGEIGFESAVGEGSTFHFVIPAPGAVTAPSSDIMAGRRVAIVSAAAPAARSLQLDLERRGARATLATSLDEADALLGQPGCGTQHDAIVVDSELPGVECLTGRLSDWRKSLVSEGLLVLLASRHSRLDLEAYRRAGVDRFLQKPFTRAEQLDALEASAASGSGGPGPTEVGVVAPPPDRRRTLRALVAEDNAVNQKLACRMLERLRCVVDTADNGRDAVEMAARNHYDVVFMDCQMPVMDGYAATAAIRASETGARIPIVALTANALSGDRIRCLEAGMDDYIAKPFRSDEIERVLDRIAGAKADG